MQSSLPSVNNSFTSFDDVIHPAVDADVAVLEYGPVRQTDEIRFVQNKEVINLRGSVIPIIRSHEILDLEELEVQPENYVVVIMQKGDQRVGMIVDNLIGQQETVIKSLGRHITNEKLFSGATILGDGEVALIFDTNTLI